MDLIIIKLVIYVFLIAKMLTEQFPFIKNISRIIFLISSALTNIINLRNLFKFLAKT